MVKTDITKMTVEEIGIYLQEKKEREVTERHQRAIKAKAELEKYCQEKYGLTLAQVFTASDKEPAPKKLFKHPDGEQWSYSGKGRIKEKFQDPKDTKKPNPAYAVN